MWQDTVIPLEYSALDGLQCAGIPDEKILRALKAQAEVSFKAGVEQGIELVIEDVISGGKGQRLQKKLEKFIEDARKAGMREVVEWLVENTEPFLDANGFQHLRIKNSKWQAQLKEWGISPRKED